MTYQDILAHIDYTYLKATATWEQIKTHCEKGQAQGVACVCIPPSYVKRVREAFPTLKLCSVAGFPLGYSTAEIKAAEAALAVRDGADEVDIVVNLGDVKDGAFDKVEQEIAAVKAAMGKAVLKVIAETCYLTREEKIALCHAVTQGGADYIKTSTGLATAGATVEDVQLFRDHVGPGVKIKAAGGVRTREQMERFLQAGCDRIGASALPDPASR